MQACSLLLGHPWEHDNDALHYGRSNKYSFMYKEMKITLLPLNPAEIVEVDREGIVSAKSKRQQIANSVSPLKKDKPTPSSKAKGIKLKGDVMLATKSDLAEISDDDICYALICKQALFSHDDIPSLVSSVVTNLL
jgi:hypothetical protein